MANIHSIRDYQRQREPAGNQSNAPYWGRPASGLSQSAAPPAGNNQGIAPYWGRPASQSAPPSQAVDDEYGKPVSMMTGPTAAPIPTLKERIFPRMKLKAMTTALSIIDTAVFIATLFVGAFVSGNEMAGPSSLTLLYMGGKYEPYIRNNYEVWRLITPIFLHAGILHIAGNLFFQLRFGYTLETRWTIPIFTAIYFWTGINASLWSCVLSPESVSVGASGALFGLVGADISYVLLNWAVVPHRGMELVFIAIVIIMTFLFGMSSTVDNWAHLGGLITGLAAGASIVKPVVVRPPPIERLIRFTTGTVLVGLFVLMVLLLWLTNPHQVL